MLHTSHTAPSGNSFKPSMILSLCALALHALAGDPAPAAAATDNSAQIVNYLLGKSGSATGLDANGDSKVDIADAIHAISHRAPVVTSFAIAGGAASTASRAVKLNNACAGTPKSYMASESATFRGAAWQPYAAAPTFTLGTGNVTKTVYFKVLGANGVESAVKSDTIALAEVVPLTVGAAAVSGAIAPAGDVDAYRFTVTAASTYVVETFPGTLTDNHMRLYGPNDPTTLVAQDHNSSANHTARIARTLAPGTYTVRVQAYTAGATGSYSIRVTNIGALKVSQFAIGGGASLTTSRQVTLNNGCAGSPTQYKASESSSFSGASWTAYATAPAFTLSSGNGDKKVYFKVRDAGGTESPVASDTIALKEMTPLPADGTTVGGNISKSDESDWYVSTITASGLYCIQTYAGSLNDTSLKLAKTPNPDSDDWLATSDDISESDKTSRIMVWLEPGTYYSRVKGVDSLTGSYNIRFYQEANKVLPVNGSAVRGNIASDSDEDWYRFTVGAGGLYTIETAEDTLENGYMELRAAAAGVIATSDDISGTYTGTMPIVSAYLSAGTYLVRFVGATSDDTGTYEISVHNGAAGAGSVGLVINGMTGSGYLTLPSGNAYDTDWYQFIVAEEGTYTIQTTAGTLTEAYMSLMDADGNEGLNSGNAGGMPAFTDVPLLPGIYYVYVEPLLPTGSGSYKIKIKD